MRMLSLSYGVWAVHQPWNDSRRGYFYDALNQLIKSGRITRDNMVAYLSGSFGEGGGTTFLEINNVGKSIRCKQQLYITYLPGIRRKQRHGKDRYQRLYPVALR